MYQKRGGGGGLGLKRVCTKNGPTRVSQRQISFFPAMVTLVGGEGGPPTAISRSNTLVSQKMDLSLTSGGGGGQIRSCIHHL